MTQYKYSHADVRFNNGEGALVCNRCHIILAYGFDHVDDYHFCKKCFLHWEEWMESNRDVTLNTFKVSSLAH